MSEASLFSPEELRSFLYEALVPISKLDKKRCSELEREIALHAIGLINYVNFFNSLQDARIREHIRRFRDLPPLVLESLELRSEWALRDCKSMVVAVHELVGLFYSCDLPRILETYVPRLAKGVNSAKLELVLKRLFLRSGLTEAQARKFWVELSKAEFDIFRLLGGHGSFHECIVQADRLVAFFSDHNTSIHHKTRGETRDKDDAPFNINGGGPTTPDYGGGPSSGNQGSDQGSGGQNSSGDQDSDTVAASAPVTIIIIIIIIAILLCSTDPECSKELKQHDPN